MRIFSWLDTEALKSLVLLIAIDLVFFLFSYINHFFGKTIPFYIAFLIFLIYGVLIWIFWKVFQRYIFRIDKGISGEYAVRSVLDKLPKENFTWLPDVVIGKQGNIDFVIIGTTGVWTIEVKNHKAGKITLNEDGKLCRNGYPINSESEKNVLSQAYREADSLQKYIRDTLEIFTPVHPVIVFANKKTVLHFGYKRQKEVYVIGITYLLNLILKSMIEEKLTPEKRLKIKEDLWKYTSKF